MNTSAIQLLSGEYAGLLHTTSPKLRPNVVSFAV